ncbi:MAG: DUF4250 domain-containing protein [Sedimenticolaceae bacterium]|nr:DUF4250 domain-containing protein [Sedimenticolaceae bacterium]
MDLSNYTDMDPGMLYSLVNMRLRNDYSDLQDLVCSLDIDEQAFLEHMRGIGFEYDTEIRQFR